MNAQELDKDSNMIRDQALASDLELKFIRLKQLNDSIFDITQEIKQIKEEIRDEVLQSKESFICKFGSATLKRGSTGIKWDDSALLGYAAAGHPEIERFRTETHGKPTVAVEVFK